MGVDFGTTYTLKERARIHPYLANSIGFSLAATSNYFLNRIWTFGSQNPEILTEYASFVSVALIGLGINNLFLYLFERKLGLYFYLAKLFAIGVTILWTFFANYYYTFV